MNKFEIVTVIVGFVGIFTQGLRYKSEGKDFTLPVVACMVCNVLYKIIFASLILLPLYFNYWKK